MYIYIDCSCCSCAKIDVFAHKNKASKESGMPGPGSRQQAECVFVESNIVNFMTFLCAEIYKLCKLTLTAVNRRLQPSERERERARGIEGGWTGEKYSETETLASDTCVKWADGPLLKPESAMAEPNLKLGVTAAGPIQRIAKYAHTQHSDKERATDDSRWLNDCQRQ